MRSPRSSVLALLVTIVAVLATTMAPAAAQTDAQVTDVKPVDVRPDIAPDDRPDVIQKLRLRCRGGLNGDDMPVVRCKWTEPTIPSAEVVVLQRNDGEGWRSLWRTKNLERNRYVDGAVEPGVRYRYRVRVFDAEKNLVAASRSNGAGVPIPPIDVLKIACDPMVNDQVGKAAVCEWSASDDARGYQLWRLVNRHHRELVGTYPATTFAARDDLPEDTLVARYAVLALGDDGEIVGRSRVTTIRFPRSTA